MQKFSAMIPNGGDWQEYRQRIAGGGVVQARINRRTGEYIVLRGNRVSAQGFDAGKRQQIRADFEAVKGPQ